MNSVHTHIGLFVFLILSVSCMEAPDSVSHSQISPLHDYIHGDSVNTKFSSIEKLYIAGSYAIAIEEVASLRTEELTNLESNFIENLSIELSLLLEDTLDISRRISLLKHDIGSSSQLPELNVNLNLNEARLYFLKGDFRNSIESTHIAEQMLKTAKGINFSGLGEVHYQLARSFMSLPGKRDSAQFHYNKAVELVMSDNTTSWMISKSALSLAILDFIKRDHFIAHQHLDLAIENASLKTPSDSAFLSECYALKAKASRKLKNNRAALQEFQSAYNLLGKDEVINDRAIDRYFSERLYAASAWKEKDIWNELVIEWKKNRPSSFERSAMRVLGYGYFTEGDYDMAIEYFRTDLNVELRKTHKNFTEMYQAINYLTESHLKKGNYDSAVYYAYNGITHQLENKMTAVDWDKIKSKDFLNLKFSFYSYNLLGKSLLKKYENNLGKTSILYQAHNIYQIMDSLRVIQVKEWEEDALLQFAQIGAEAYGYATDASYLLLELTGNKKYRELIHRYFEMTKGILLYREAISKNSDRFIEVPDLLKEKENQLKAEIGSLKRDFYGYEKSADTEQKLNIKLKEQKEFLNILENKYPEYYNEKYLVRTPTISEVSDYVTSNNTTVTSYQLTSNYIYSMTWGSEIPSIERVQLTDDIVKAMDFMDSLGYFVANAEAGSVGHFIRYVESANLLYKSLIPSLSKNHEEHILIVDDRLAKLPFDAFITSKPKTNKIDYGKLDFLLYDRPISYAYSLKSLLENSHIKNASKNKSARTIFAYSYSSNESTLKAPHDLPELRGSKVAVDSIQNIYGKKSRVVYGEQLSINEIKVMLESEFDILHLATHAFSSTIDRNDNKIVFKNSKSEKSNTIYAYELLTMDIKANLVILPACNTGTGKSQKGEGTYSLARSFLIGGVDQVISTLWEVPDLSTSKVSKSLHHYLRQEIKPSEALRKAKIAFLENSNVYSKYPGAWAGMICHIQ